MLIPIRCGICGETFKVESKEVTHAKCPYCAEKTQNQAPSKIHCPQCNSTQITAQKKGFGVGKAITGTILTGGVGALAGFIGSNNIEITCLNCGYKWKAGKQ